jgi:hypothetical protein
MSIYGPAACNNTPKIIYMDSAQSAGVLKAGDTMSGELQMSGNLVRGLPTAYPPTYHGDEAASWEQVVGITLEALNTAVKLDGNDPMTGNLKMGQHQIKGAADPVDPQDVATKGYVDTVLCGHKPLITVWAEENGIIDNNEYEWSFGNGGSGANHAKCGYTMMAPGRVLRMGLAASTVASDPPGGATVNVVINGAENTDYGVTKPKGKYSGTSIFATSLELAQGDRINVRSAISHHSITCAVVSILIELDL